MHVIEGTIFVVVHRFAYTTKGSLYNYLCECVCMYMCMCACVCFWECSYMCIFF